MRFLRLQTLRVFANILIFSGFLLLFFTVWPTVSSEIAYWRLHFFSRAENAENWRPFNLLAHAPTPLRSEPVSKEFSIIIEKIGVNAPIVSDVSVVDRNAYQEALRHGVAHARGTVKPGQVGNIYLFAHSSLDFWELGKYATVFNLLRKLEKGDRIVLIYKDNRYDYRVSKKEIVSGFETAALLEDFSTSKLTLQTCHPPGTTFNRLIIHAREDSSPR